MEAEQRMEENMSHSAADCKSLGTDVFRQLSILQAAAPAALVPQRTLTNAELGFMSQRGLQIKINQSFAQFIVGGGQGEHP